MSDETIYPMRLQRFLARAGVASRRGSERLMTEGRVRVNGVVVTELGSKVDPLADEVTVDGMPCSIAETSVYLVLNKPAGYLTTMNDPKGRPCVASLVPCDRYPGLFPVGRLDADTTGVLLFTTNGMAGQNLLHPSHHVDKHYVALVEGVPTKDQLAELRRGVMLDDGPAAPAEAKLLNSRDPLAEAVAPYGVAGWQSVVGITIHEGRKHQVKRMLAAIGHPVVALHRDAFGPLGVADVEEGCWRMLTLDERSRLERAAGLVGGA